MYGTDFITDHGLQSVCSVLSRQGDKFHLAGGLKQVRLDEIIQGF